MGVCMTDYCIDKLAKSISSAGKPEFFEDFVEYLRTILPFENVIVLVFNGEATPTVVLTKTDGAEVFARLKTVYLAATYVLDPVYQFHNQKGDRGVYWLEEMAPDNFLRSRYYEWYYGRIGILDEITIFQPVNETTTVTISMGTNARSGRRFTSKEEKSLKKMAAVIHALIDCDWEFRKHVEGPGTSAGPLFANLQALLDDRHGIQLSGRQAQIAIMILQGHSSPSIARDLGISPQTVKVFRRQLYTKCGITSQSELFAMMLPLLGEISAFSSE